MKPTPRAIELAEPIRRVMDVVKTDVLRRARFDPASTTRTFTIGDNDKRYVEGQPMFIPGAGGLKISGTMFQAAAADSYQLAVSNGWEVGRNVRVLGEDLSSGAQIIEQGQTFGVEEDPTQDHWNAAYTTQANTTKPPGVGIGVFYGLWGHWLRGVQ